MTLVELTAQGANKGGIGHMAPDAGHFPENVVCVGDPLAIFHADMGGTLGCAPASAIPQVRETPGVRAAGLPGRTPSLRH